MFQRFCACIFLATKGSLNFIIFIYFRIGNICTWFKIKNVSLISLSFNAQFLFLKAAIFTHFVDTLCFFIFYLFFCLARYRDDLSIANYYQLWKELRPFKKGLFGGNFWIFSYYFQNMKNVHLFLIIRVLLRQAKFINKNLFQGQPTTYITQQYSLQRNCYLCLF